MFRCRAKKKRERKLTLEGVWVPEKAGLLSKTAWLQSQLNNVVFSTIKCLNSRKNVVSTLIKDKDITSYQLLLIKQVLVLVN